MIFKRDDFKLQDLTILGHLIFTPPFKASAPMENEARFVHVLKGKSRLYYPNGHLNLSSGDSVVMKCENFVNHWFKNDDDQSNEIIVIHFYPDVLKQIYDNQIPTIFSDKQKGQHQPVELIPNNAGLENFVKSLAYYFDNPGLITDEFIKIKVRELILVLINSDTSGQIKAILSDLFKSEEYEFKEIIHAHLFEDLNLDDLAFFAGLSLSSFKRKFKTVFNTSPTHYIKTKRLEKAESLVLSSDQRISEIAYDCGFNDISYFSKAFAAKYQLSPTVYRKQHMG